MCPPSMDTLLSSLLRKNCPRFAFRFDDYAMPISAGVSSFTLLPMLFSANLLWVIPPLIAWIVLIIYITRAHWLAIDRWVERVTWMRKAEEEERGDNWWR